MKILVVDDSVSSRTSTAGFLRKLNHEVDEAENGYEALKRFFIYDYSMILTDIRMPEMSGIDLLRVISATPQFCRVDVVLFTAYKDIEYAIEAVRLGARDFLLKPLNIDELVRLTEKIALSKGEYNFRKKKAKVLVINCKNIWVEGLKKVINESDDFYLHNMIDGIETNSPRENVEVQLVVVDYEHINAHDRNNLIKLKGKFPNSKIVLIVSLGSARLNIDNAIEHVDAVIRCGLNEKELLDIIRLTMSGKKYIDPILKGIFFSLNLNKEPLMEILTKKEIEILKALAAGKTNKEIAAKMYLSTSTIRSYVSKILEKLNLPNRAAAAASAAKYFDG